jgi:tRNA-specific 2-thiouridylase
MCNREIKFKAFLEHAQTLGARRIATGHYVRSRKQKDEIQLLKGCDADKDQSYFLYALNQQQISHALFPIGELEKGKVRSLAEKHKFSVFDKKDSTGICFIGERKFKDFLQRFIPAQPGIIESIDGEQLGEHSGLMYYTIGQRQGLGIGGTTRGSDSPWYVVEKQLATNILVVAQGHHHPLLYNSTCTIGDLHWISRPEIDLPYACRAKIRYRQQDQVCNIISIDNSTATVEFETPQRAITPGQALVFYQHDICLGGGTIETAFNS